MSAMSDYLEEDFLHYIFDNTVFIGLALSGAFTDSSYATEASGQGYARVTLVSGSFTIADAGGGQWQAKNNSLIQFAVASGDYSDDVVGWGLFDAASGDNLLVHETCSAQTIGAGRTPLFLADAIIAEAK